MCVERLSVQILLPEAIEKRFQRWASRTPGASWPQWGGHITLLPAFAATVERALLEVRMAQICAKYPRFTINLSQITAMQDWTRPHYKGVFLTFGAEADNGQLQLLTLQRDLDAALRPLRDDLVPEVSRKPFWPHITLAIGLADAEANLMVNGIRADGLTAQFEVDSVWLLTFRQPEGEELQVERSRIALGAPVSAAPLSPQA
jgi:2'-5' RNA ligase